ncbi:MAG: phosphonate ABC transporter, permease protein PhnE [Acidobacteria bacterium]|nr:phosphonate ABC transporter, permease protein PhnE [Acidobacteriota bacterium]
MSARRPSGLSVTAALAAAVALVMMADLGLLDRRQLSLAWSNTVVFVGELFPPSAQPMPTLLDATVETLQIAYVGTVLGFIAALPLAILATRTIFGPYVAGPVRLLLAAVRTVPALLWAVVFVVAFGLGPAAGALGIAAYTLGYLGKLLYEAFEGVDHEVVDAVWSVGCNRVQLTRFAVLPEAANQILSQLLFVFEYNVRASSIMGFVGAGGIGFHLLGYLQLLQYRNLLTALLLTLGLVLLIDYASSRVRRLVLPPLAHGA